MVVAIIAMFMSMFMVYFGEASIKARDARRKADLRQIQTALEIYYNINEYYPYSAISVENEWVCSIDCGGECQSSSILEDFLQDLVEEELLRVLPRDPINDGIRHSYTYASWSTVRPEDINCVASPQQYILIIELEKRRGFWL